MMPIEILRWDSRHFGCRIARFTSARLTPARARAAMAACLKKKVTCLYFLCSSEDTASIAGALANGFRLVDVRVMLDKALGLSPAPASFPAALRFRTARPSDIQPLQRMARTLFTDSRFAVDPGFPRQAHQRLFSIWVAKSVRRRYDDWVGVAEWNGRLAGFISCRRSGPGAGTIGLFGVSRSFRRRGIGRGLLNQGFEWFRARGLRRLSVVTQGRAITAQRTYQDSGFRTTRVDLWFHKWC